MRSMTCSNVHYQKPNQHKENGRQLFKQKKYLIFSFLCKKFVLEKCFFLSFIHPSFFSVHLFTCLISCCEGKQLQQAGQEVHGRHVSPHAAPGGGGPKSTQLFEGS